MITATAGSLGLVEAQTKSLGRACSVLGVQVPPNVRLGDLTTSLRDLEQLILDMAQVDPPPRRRTDAATPRDASRSVVLDMRLDGQRIASSKRLASGGANVYVASSISPNVSWLSDGSPSKYAKMRQQPRPGLSSSTSEHEDALENVRFREIADQRFKDEDP